MSRWRTVREWEGRPGSGHRYLLLRDVKGHSDGTPIIVWCRRTHDIAGNPMVEEVVDDARVDAQRWLAADLDTQPADQEPTP